MQVAERLLDLVERELAQLVEHEAGRSVARDLAAELGPDRSARAGDQHSPALDDSGDAGFVELDRFAPEQIFRLDAAHALDARAAVLQLARRGNRQHRQERRRGKLDGAAPGRQRSAGHGDDDVRRALQDLRPAHVIESALDRHVADPRMALGRIVVEQSQHLPALVAQPGQQHARRFAGAHHHGAPRFHALATPPRARLLVEHRGT